MQQKIEGLLAAVLLVAAGQAGAATEERNLEGFDRVLFALPGTLTLARGDGYQVVIDADEEDLPRIETRLSGSELTIRWKDGPLRLFGGPDGPVSVQVTLPQLRGLEVAGSGDVDGGSWQAEEFSVEVNGSGSARFAELGTEELSLELAGSGSVDVAQLDAAFVRVEISGSGDTELAGAADRQEIRVMGSGNVNAAELEGAQVDVEIMGSGDVKVWASESLSAEVLGSGDVRYRGSPKVDIEQHGSGRVRAL